MSRDITKDCNIFIDFLNHYNLSELLDNRRFIQELRAMHKKVYGYLLFITELEQQNNQSKIFSEISLEYLKESGSDMMQSIFCWANGSYKPAKLLLRSSIETFIKALLGIENEEIFEEKSVYKVFDLAQNHSFFTSIYGKKYIESIHNSYKTLCMTAHSAPDINLASISSMEILPRYDINLSLDFCSIFINTLETILSTILLNFNLNIQNMHALNKGLFLSTLTLSNKKEILEHLSKLAI